MDEERVGRGYAEHLNDADLMLLSRAAGVSADADGLRRNPALVPRLLEREEMFEEFFGRQEDRPLVGVSPFLAFAVLVHHVAAELTDIRYLPDRAGPRQRVPVFDVPQLHDFLGAPWRRLFLAELLASFARVSSGRYWTKTPHGWRSRRYNELDPLRLTGLVDAVPEVERPGVYRRLGDVALFLTGIFPDYVSMYALRPFDAARLLRAAGVSRDVHDELAAAPPLTLFEHLGHRWYRQAYSLVPVASEQLEVVAEVADRFHQARRVLNHIADRYLFQAGNPWFPSPEG
ncbi:MAG: hypothetical protein GEV03_27200 [Streptosporangiales bacterium]|nr:hypothetical protein [Streptosporangiales bacterium]